MLGKFWQAQEGWQMANTMKTLFSSFLLSQASMAPRPQQNHPAHSNGLRYLFTSQTRRSLLPLRACQFSNTNIN